MAQTPSPQQQWVRKDTLQWTDGDREQWNVSSTWEENPTLSVQTDESPVMFISWRLVFVTFYSINHKRREIVSVSSLFLLFIVWCLGDLIRLSFHACAILTPLPCDVWRNTSFPAFPDPWADFNPATGCREHQRLIPIIPLTQGKTTQHISIPTWPISHVISQGCCFSCFFQTTDRLFTERLIFWASE